MPLSGHEIERLAKEGKQIKIVPFNPKQVNPNSYNLRLDNKLLVYDVGYIGKTKYGDGILPVHDNYLDQPFDISSVSAIDCLDMKENNPVKEIIIPEEGYILHPGRIYLGKTVEYTETEGLIPAIEGRSSIGRLGLYVHITAGFGDVGFKGYWTLELHCVQPIRIYPNVEICQIYYEDIQGMYTPYESKYQNNTTVQSSMLYKDFEDMNKNSTMR